jgi:hypothetical protein
MKARALPARQAIAVANGSWNGAATPQRAPGAEQESPPRWSTATTLRVFEPRVATTARAAADGNGPDSVAPHA